MSQTIGLLGDGNQANEIESYLPKDITVAFRAVSSQYLNPANQRLIDIKNSEHHEDTPVIAAIGAPELRKEIINAWQHTKYFTLVSENAYVDESVKIGKGSIVAPGAVITTNVQIGDHTLVNIGVTLSHDCQIGDFVTISPGAHIAGKVKIGDGAFIGIGASISNNITIAPGCVIGAGSVVIEDVPEENSVIVGVPGKVIKQNKGWLRGL